MRRCLFHSGSFTTLWPISIVARWWRCSLARKWPIDRLIRMPRSVSGGRCRGDGRDGRSQDQQQGSGPRSRNGAFVPRLSRAAWQADHRGDGRGLARTDDDRIAGQVSCRRQVQTLSVPFSESSSDGSTRPGDVDVAKPAVGGAPRKSEPPLLIGSILWAWSSARQEDHMNRHALEQNQAPSRPKLRPGKRLAVTYRALSELKLAPKHPRRHDRRQIRQIAHSIETFDFNVPILVDGQLNVIAGHGRVLAARELGYGEVPTIDLGHLNEAQKRAFMIADNRLTEVSVWNDRLLAESLKYLATLDLDFSIEATGFAMAEIDLRIEGLVGKAEQEDPADALPDNVTGIPISQLGDLWLLGRHLLLCGNALDQPAYERVMDGKQATLVFVDPPYNVKVDGHVSGLGRTRHREFAMASGEMDPNEFTAFLARACSLMTRHSVDGAINFICMDWRHMGELLTAARDIYSELKNICVWVKHNAGMGSFYRGQHELVFVFKHGKGSHRNNVRLGQHGRHRSNVWSYRGANDFGRGNDEGNLARLHPTVKPVMMVQDAILDCSGRGEIALDPFLGSGTSLIAAERAGRRCFGLEIDPLYVDTIIRRWQAFTGDHAHHAVTARAFDDVASERDGNHGA